MPLRLSPRSLMIVPLALALIVVLAGQGRHETPVPGGDRGALWVPVLSGLFDPDETTVSECGTLPEDRRIRCYTQAFGNIAYHEGGISAIHQLMAQASLGEGGIADCHVIAHMIGVAAYHGLGGDFARGLAEGSSECESGYYHGLVAAEIASRPVASPEELGSRTALACRKYSQGLVLDECYHGIGHAAEHIYDYETPTALRACVSMNQVIVEAGDAEDARLTALHSCTQGVFMENFQAGGGPDHRWTRANDPIYPCEEFPEELGASCWDMVSWKVQMEPGDTLERFTARRWSVCARASLQSWRMICNDHTTRGVLAIFPNFSIRPEDQTTPDLIARLCSKDPAGTATCFRSIALQAVLTYSDVALSATLCSRAESDDLLRSCGAGIGTALHLSRLEIEQCDKLRASAMIDACRATLLAFYASEE